MTFVISRARHALEFHSLLRFLSCRYTRGCVQHRRIFNEARSDARGGSTGRKSVWEVVNFRCFSLHCVVQLHNMDENGAEFVVGLMNPSPTRIRVFLSRWLTMHFPLFLFCLVGAFVMPIKSSLDAHRMWLMDNAELNWTPKVIHENVESSTKLPQRLIRTRERKYFDDDWRLQSEKRFDAFKIFSYLEMPTTWFM